MTNMGKCACDMCTSPLFLYRIKDLVLYMKLKIRKSVKS